MWLFKPIGIVIYYKKKYAFLININWSFLVYNLAADAWHHNKVFKYLDPAVMGLFSLTHWRSQTKKFFQRIFSCIFQILVSSSLIVNLKIHRKKGITLRIYQYWIFQHTVIETCFEMLKSPDSNYNSSNFFNCSEVWTTYSSISFYYKILRLGALMLKYTLKFFLCNFLRPKTSEKLSVNINHMNKENVLIDRFVLA